MSTSFCKYWIFIFSVLTFTACQNEDSSTGDHQFELIKPEKTGLKFENKLIQTPDFNVFTYMYFFNGGGVAAGDFNQDGLDDLFFTSNMGPNKLFLNKGNFKFEDVTDKAGLAGQEGWTSGCTAVDINNDGLLDLYVSQLGDYKTITGSNQFYICKGVEDGIPIFEDKAAAMGVNLKGFATHATFFDYDLDGDLDLFQLNHSVHQNGTFGPRKEFKATQHNLAGDRLFRNDSTSPDQIKFTEVTETSGIISTVLGYGLGVATSDINSDGWPDLYIANDFHENDYLYINQQDGTFKEVLADQIRHTSRFSMGVDMADINNDGLNEIFTLDMLPYDPYILKTSLGEDGFDIFKFKLGYGYHPQFARNNLQLNLGGDAFSEIGMFAGIEATDWSWAALFLDFDYDGYKDLFISNGIPRRMNDIDYINFRQTEEIDYKADANRIAEEDLNLVETMPQIKLPNKFFRNTGDLKFEDWGATIKNDASSFSNGAVYVDLDNDGDLDIVVNNIDDAPYVYKNQAIEKGLTENQSYLNLDLKGSPDNRQAIGARALIFKGKEQLTYEHYPVRGYQSSVAPGLYLGLGDPTLIDSILLIWPDQSYQRISPENYNQTISLEWKPGLTKFEFNKAQDTNNQTLEFNDLTQSLNLNFQHKENPFVDFNREPLMPHMASAEGPALAVADVNGDGLEDFYIGGAKRQASVLYLQNSAGTFIERTPTAIHQDSIYEEVDAVFADVDNDEDADLIIVSGGNEYRLKSKQTQARLFLNDGKGNFTRSPELDSIHLQAACVEATDFDNDGDIDLFLGARCQSWNYGLPPTSFLMSNDGKGKFSVVTDEIAPGLKEAGMVKDAKWEDIDGDGNQDLILATEWQAIQIWLNKEGKFKAIPIHSAKGWWNFVQLYDLDSDGDLDILAGNLGQNAKFQPTTEEPIRLYVNDYDDNGQIEQILTYYLEGKELPFANFAELTKTLVSLKKDYLFAKDLAKASIEEIFGVEKLQSATILEANMLKNVWFENTGALDQFKLHPLPDELQFAPLNAGAAINDKGDFIVGGNFFQSNIEMGWYDANMGNILEINSPTDTKVSPLGNLRLEGQIRKIAPIKIGKQTIFLIAKNDGALQALAY